MENKLVRCFIHCYNASEKILMNMKLRKDSIDHCEYQIRCMISAFQPTDKEAYIYAEFDQIREDLLKKNLELVGMTQIHLVSFSRSNTSLNAKQALGHVLSKSKKPGFKKLERGNTKVVPVSEEELCILGEDMPKLKHHNEGSITADNGPTDIQDATLQYDDIISSPIQPEQQTAIGNAELVRKLDQALEEQRRMNEENRKLLELVALQGKQLREIVTNQQGSTSIQTQINQAVQEINQNVLIITNSQAQMTEAVQEIKTSQAQHHQEHLEQGKQLNELAQGLDHVDTNIQAIVDDKSDSTFLVDNLEVTTRERDDLRGTVRSQAGKMGAVTKRLNEALSENQELKAAREKSIEYQEVITAVEGVREELRRAEQRIATHLQIADAPLGEPDFNPTYERFHEVAPSEYTTALKKICMEAKQVIKRRDHPPVAKFPAVAESRKYHIDMATALYRDKDSLFKIAKSSAGHRMDLVLLGMPVMHQYHFNLLRKSFESVLKWMSERVSEAYAKDRTQYRLMEDVWNSDEVSAGKPCECLEMTRRMCCR